MTDSTADHLVLVGLMGSGKSSVGRRVADALGRPFVDTDLVIERRVGRSIREIFADEGEESFRDMESAVLSEVLSASTASVIATGGGVVGRERNRDLLSAHRVVWLRATIDTLSTRLVSGRSRRPLLDGDVRRRLIDLDDQRRDHYHAVASVTVDVDDRSLDDVVREVLTVTESR